MIVFLVAACGGAFTSQEGAAGSGGSAGGSVGAGGSAGDAGASAAGGAFGSAGASGSVGASGSGGAAGSVGASGSGGAIGVGDAGVPPPRDAAPPDASIFDATPPRDGTTVGNSFCGQTPHTFCCDFDQPNALAQWSSQIQRSGGTLTISSTQSMSPPSSLLVKSPTSPDMSSSEADLQRTFDFGITKQAHLVFDLQTISMPTSGNSNAVTLSNGKMTIMINLLETNGQVLCHLSVFGGTYVSPSTACPAPMMMGKWNHFDMTVTVNGQSVAIQLTQNTLAFAVLYQLPMWMGTASFSIGSYPGDPMKFWNGYYDNVALDIQ